VFPNGEDFFVDSVRNYRDVVEHDPDMKAKVRGFIGQEAMHGREHRSFNERLAAVGYPTAALDSHLLKVANRLRKLPKPVQLAITAASEHFTSTLAHALLSDEETRRTLFASPDGQLLITWHALEELEHKDVAFDLFERVSGSYAVRMLGLGLAAVGFGRVVLLGYVRAASGDRRHLNRGALKTHRRNLAKQRMVSLEAGREILEYVRPGFHPRDINTDALVVEWRQVLEPQMTANRRVS